MIFLLIYNSAFILGTFWYKSLITKKINILDIEKSLILLLFIFWVSDFKKSSLNVLGRTEWSGRTIQKDLPQSRVALSQREGLATVRLLIIEEFQT